MRSEKTLSELEQEKRIFKSIGGASLGILLVLLAVILWFIFQGKKLWDVLPYGLIALSLLFNILVLRNKTKAIEQEMASRN